MANQNSDFSQGLSYDDNIIDDTTNYPIDHFTATQCSLFIGPIWVENFVALKFKESSTKAPIYGWNEMYSDMDSTGNFLVQGTLTMNYNETDYLFRTINHIRDQIQREFKDNESIDDILNQQKGKFKTRIEARILEDFNKTGKDFTEAAKLIEKAQERVDELINELVNQEEDIFNYDLTLVTGNYKSKDAAIKIFEKFNITDEIHSAEPDDSPLYTTYSFYARKQRSKRSPKLPAPVNLKGTTYDVPKMIDLITTQLVDGFYRDNIVTLLALKKSNNSKDIFALAASPDYVYGKADANGEESGGKKRGLLDPPIINIRNETTNSGRVRNKKTNTITSNIDKTSKIGYGGLVNRGTNNYGDKLDFNKIVIEFECPKSFDFNQDVYKFSNQATLNQDGSVSASFKSGEKSAIKLDNSLGQLMHIDHEIMLNDGYDIITKIIPSPFTLRGSGFPVRTLINVTKTSYNGAASQFYTNSLLSYSEPITVIEGIKKSKDANYITKTIKMPLFTFTYWDALKFIKTDGSNIQKVVKPLPIYMVDTLVSNDSLDKFKTSGEIIENNEENKKVLEQALLGKNGEDFFIFPINTFKYTQASVLNDNPFGDGADFDYNTLTLANIKSKMQAIYATGPVNWDKLKGYEKAMHLIPVIYMGDNPASTYNSLAPLMSYIQNYEPNKEAEIPWDIHYDYLLKDTNSLSPAGLTDALSFSYIHGIRKKDNMEPKPEQHDFVVVYYLVLAAFPNFQTKAKDQEYVDEKNKTIYKFINYKGFSRKVTNRQPVATQNRPPTLADLTYDYPVGRKIGFEMYVRSDYKSYDIQDSLIDSLANFIGSFLPGATFKNIKTYSKEIAQYTGYRLDPGSSETDRILNEWVGPHFKQWWGYLKSIPGSIINFLGGVEQSTLGSSTILNGPLGFLAEEEKIVKNSLTKAVAFANDIYIIVDLLQISIQLRDIFYGEKFAESAKAAYGEQESTDFDKYVVSVLRKKLLDNNNADVDKVQIRDFRFGTKSDKKVIADDKLRRTGGPETMYIKLSATKPSDTEIVRFLTTSAESQVVAPAFEIVTDDIIDNNSLSI